MTPVDVNNALRNIGAANINRSAYNLARAKLVYKLYCTLKRKHRVHRLNPL